MNAQLFFIFIVILGTVFADDFATQALPDKSVCGMVRENPRIMGGKITQIGEFPWVVGLEYNSTHTGETLGIRAGGSLISNRYILTAASSMVYSEYKLIGVRLGEWRISTDPDCIKLVGNVECADPVLKLKIEKQIPYPLFDKKTGFNDIGLLRLEHEIVFTDFITPICLPSPNLPSPEVGAYMTIAGWGRTENDSLSDVQLKVQVPVVSNDICSLKLPTANISSQELCAGGELGKDSCHGDLGQALMRIYEDELKENWYQDGIVSRGAACGREGFPGIYTRVSSYMNWIINVISEE